MSLKEEKYLIFEDGDVPARLLIADVDENGFLLGDSKLIQTKGIEENGKKDSLFKPEMSFASPVKMTDLSENTVRYVTDCSVCQNTCSKCKSICVTCRAPCQKCTLLSSCKNSSTDTDDFDKYLDSQSKKVKIQPKVKTIGIDTCDLESHFDYYKLERKTIRIQKSVATDCIDLIARRVTVKKPVRNTVSTDTSDLLTSIQSKADSSDDSGCEFFWSKRDDSKTYSKKGSAVSASANNENSKNSFNDNSVSANEDSASSQLPPYKEREDDKENYNMNQSVKEITFDSGSTSDDSDVDILTSCKLSKSRKLARAHGIKLRQVPSDQGPLFKCSVCDETFQKKYLGTLHAGSHADGDKFKCLTCDKLFSSLDLLRSHVPSHLSEREGNPKGVDGGPGSNVENSTGDRSKLKKTFRCDLCPGDEGSQVPQVFESSKALYLHKKTEHGVVVEAGKGEKKLRIKREFICLICGKQFKSSKALKDHSPVHTGEKKYHCDICNKSYTTSANLNIHKRTHTGARNFVCTVCNKAFHKKDSLKVHFRKHSGERPFQCDLCPMNFDRNYILKNHRYTHFPEKTFICPVCGKTFSTHGGLNNHEKSHRKDPFPKKPRKPAVKPTLDAEKAVICDVCGKIYSTRSNLRIHKLVHLGVKPFECTICHQTYAKKDSMLTHMRKHTDERPFACETCGMTFYRNHTLKTHLLRHTGERPHTCKMCGKGFTQSSSLAYHVRNHDRKMQGRKGGDGTKARKKRGSTGEKPEKKSDKEEVTGGEAEEEGKTGMVFESEEGKTVFVDKKGVDGPVSNLPMTTIPEKGPDFLMTVPSDKEIVILEKGIGVDLPKVLAPARGMDDDDDDMVDKTVTCNSQFQLGKFNYYIAKSHVFSLPKDQGVSKGKMDKSDGPGTEDMENLIVSKSGYITKEGTLITLGPRDGAPREVKGDFVEVREPRYDVKSHPGLPIAGEILNATFINDENGDVIPFGSMTLQSLNAENVLISPVISVEANVVPEKRAFPVRSPAKLTVLDSKIAYTLPGSRLVTGGDKGHGKVGSCHVVNVKDDRSVQAQKVHIELDPGTFPFQGTVVEETPTLHGLPGFYNGIQQNGL